MMKTKIVLTILIVTMVISSCITISATPSASSFVIASETSSVTHILPANTKEITLTSTVDLINSTDNLTITPQIIDWSELPTLHEISLTQDEICSIETVCLDHRDRSSAIDVTSELGDVCLWDCVKIDYKTREWLISIIMIRAGDEIKALSTSENFRSEFLKYSVGEFTSNEIRSMPDFLWGIHSKLLEDFMLNTTVGTSIGHIVVLINLRESHCTIDSDGDFICEGDIGWSSYIAVQFANLQIEKLRNAGYLQ